MAPAFSRLSRGSRKQWTKGATGTSRMYGSRRGRLVVAGMRLARLLALLSSRWITIDSSRRRCARETGGPLVPAHGRLAGPRHQERVLAQRVLARTLKKARYAAGLDVLYRRSESSSIPRAAPRESAGGGTQE